MKIFLPLSSPNNSRVCGDFNIDTLTPTVIKSFYRIILSKIRLTYCSTPLVLLRGKDSPNSQFYAWPSQTPW